MIDIGPRWRIASALAVLCLASTSAPAACFGPEQKPPGRWARIIDQDSDLVMDGEVVRTEDRDRGLQALVRPLKIYKGKAPAMIAMALPRADGMIVTEDYAGFPAQLGERSFLLLSATPKGYITGICEDVAVKRPAIRRALLRRLAREERRLKYASAFSPN